MGGFPAGRAGVLVAAVAASLIALAPAAHADVQVTVRGTDFPGPGAASLSFVGCTAPYDQVAEQPLPYLSRDNASAGRRSLGFDLAGGNAVGSLHVVGSMATTETASLAVRAPDGTTGVAYAGFQEPADEGTDRLWFGRAALVAEAGRWTTVDATVLDYTWVKYDTATHEVVDPGSGLSTSVPAFVARHGDGPGLYTIGFGCDGKPFTVDALRVGSPGSVTTYDLEGMTSSVSIKGTARTITKGERVTISGTLRSGSGNAIPHGTVILEQQRVGTSGWHQVEVADAEPGAASVNVRPDTSTLYRWRFVDRPAYERSVSGVFLVTVLPKGQEPEPDPEPTPDPTPDPAPDPAPETTPSPEPTPEPSPTSDPTPSPSPSPSPSGTTSDQPSDTASPSPEPTAVESAADSLTPSAP